MSDVACPSFLPHTRWAAVKPGAVCPCVGNGNQHRLADPLEQAHLAIVASRTMIDVLQMTAHMVVPAAHQGYKDKAGQNHP